MFKLVNVEDTIRVEPHLFPSSISSSSSSGGGHDSSDKRSSKEAHENMHDVVMASLNQKYANRVIEDFQTGLAILVYDIISLREPKIQPGDGSTFFNVQFRLIVFSPFLGEVIEGVVRTSNETGIQVTLGFFDDIFIPESGMQDDTFFDAKSSRWVWNYGDGHELRVEVGETLRFRVMDLSFDRKNDLKFVMAEDSKETSELKAPMKITASINGDGLGAVAWWQ